MGLKELITTCYKSQNFREFSAEDILEILNAVRDELKIFFTSSKTALLEAQKLLLENEKITKDELGAIFKKSLDSLE